MRMELERIVVGALATNCYILKSDKTGIIVDPGDEARKILAAASGLDIQIILATHRHFDHVAALEPVKQALGVRAAIHGLDRVSGFDAELKDGQVIEFGTDRLTVIHTPGHTPGGCCFLIGGALIAGDTLFPGGPGNTSYAGGDEKAIRRSIRERLMVLPDETAVYPGHGESTTIGRERSLY